MAKPLLRPINLEITEVFLCTLKVCLSALLGMKDHMDFCLKGAQGSFKHVGMFPSSHPPSTPFDNHYCSLSLFQ